LEQYHQVRITDKALHQAVQLSQRYLLERKLPEKALSVLDTACARVALAQKSTPLLLTGTLEQIVHLQEELRLLQREQLNGDNHSWRLEQLTHELEHLKTLQTKQKERWHQELNLVNQFHQLEQTLENEPFSALPKTEPNFSNPFLPGEMANETPIGPENQKTSFQTETNDPKIVQNAPRFSLPKLKQSEKAKPTKGDEIPLVQPLPKAEKPNQFGPSNFPLSNGAVADPFYSAQLNVENEPNKEENTLLLLDDDDSLLLPGNRSSQETENLSLQIDNLENLSKTSPNPTKREPGKIPAFLRKKRMIAQSESSPQNHLLGESTKVSPVSQPLPKVVKRESVTFHKEKVPNQAEIPALEREEAEMISELKTVAIQKSEFIQSQQLPVDTKEAETILGPKPENAKAPQIQEQVANYKIEPNGLEQESEQTQRTDNDESESNGLEQIQHPDNDKIESNGFEQEPEKTKSLDNDERESKGLEQEPKSEQAKCPNNYVADIPSAYHPQNKTKRLQADLNTVKQKLAKIQGHDPMIPAQVDERIIAAVISDWVNIPVNQMLIDEIHTVLSLKKKMVNRVLGQPRALDILAKQIQTHRANLNNAHKLCAFFLTGPRGVGKTETAITLAEILFASERNLLTLNMEDYQKIEAISTLIGISPSSLSYSKTGTLIEAVQKNPYCVILLEDIEKAHPTFISFLQQILTHGTLKLAQAQRVDFRNTLILLTSHLGSEAIIRLCNAPAITPNLEQVQEAIYPELCQHFQPDFLSRLVIVPYYAFSEIEIRRIVKLKLAQLQQRCREQYKARLTYDDSVINMLVNRCTDVDRGAHHINAILMENLLPSLAVEILERMAYEQGFHAVHLTCNKQSHFNFQFDTTKLLPTENLPIPEDGPNQPSYHQLLDELDEVLDGLKMVNSE
jgi:ATP-dependent Clp protease ATP-binding subunit ClpA